jgi:hemerythrin-like domain-containing protein
MSDLHPVDVLVGEHRLIERVLDAVEQRASTIENGPFPGDFFRKAIDFIKNFADGRHHFKEEECLFPMLGAHGLPKEGGPVACMLHEHTVGRECVAAMSNNLEAADSGSKEAAAAVRQNALAYVQLLRQHIYKEDNILFRMAKQLINGQEADRLSASYAGAEDKCQPEEKYRRLADELAAEALPQCCQH